jgi:hypothetical protein
MQYICRAAEQIHSIPNAMYLFSRNVENGAADAALVGSTVWAYSLLGTLGIPKNFFILTTVELPLF